MLCSCLQVSAGARHTIAMSRQAAFGWGFAGEGQLGPGISEPALLPRHIRSLPMQPPMLYLVACGDHSFAAAGEQRHLVRTLSGDTGLRLTATSFFSVLHCCMAESRHSLLAAEGSTTPSHAMYEE